MEYLDYIEVNFPSNDPAFFHKLFSFLKIDHKIPSLPADIGSIYPRVLINELPKKNLTINFCTNLECQSIEVKNYTKEEWKSNYNYEYIEISDVAQRLKDNEILYVDHVGINLPWRTSTSEPHPIIQELRSKLKDKCLYHLFPTGENWDFIIPGTMEEILKSKSVDYTKDRIPKFEIVSFETSSKPILQIDVATDLEYSQMKDLFREAILLDDIKSAWVYLKSNYYFDVCLVLNEKGRGWTEYFKAHRLIL